MFRKKDDSTPLCPFLDKPCLKHGCMLYTHIQGTHPQSGATVDHWDCSFKIMPLIMMDQVRKTEGVQAATVDSRNEMAKHAKNMMTAAMLSKQGRNFIPNTDVIIEDASNEPKQLDKK